MRKILGIAFIIIVACIILSNPSRTIANWFWPESPAPWEDINAIYYPDINNLTNDVRNLDIGSIEACRNWAEERAIENEDPNMLRSDYECGVSCKPMSGGIYRCRITVE